MKRILTLTLASVLFLAGLAGCAKPNSGDPPEFTGDATEAALETGAPDTEPAETTSPETEADVPVIAETEVERETTPPTTEPTVELPTVTTTSDMFTDRDMNYWYYWNNNEPYVTIKLNGNSVSCDSKSVQVDGTTVVIKNEGAYLLTGELNDGQIVINAGKKDKVRLILSGVTINSSKSAPIYVLNADKVYVTLDTNTVNTLSNGGEFANIDENNINSVIYSKQDITFNGADAKLIIKSPAGHGISGKDDVIFTSGQYEINSASHGIDANDSVRLVNASLIIDSGKDGIHVENSEDTEKGFFYAESGYVTINSAGDGISSSAYTEILGGSYNIIAGGGAVNGEKQTSDNWGMGGFFGGGPGGRPGNKGNGNQNTSTTTTEATSIKGIKSAGDIKIKAGEYKIDSADDAIHSNSSVTIIGGQFEIASGDDGIHADETLTISGGKINISESYEGLEGLNIKVEGGDVSLVSSDDGINAAGGTDSSGFGGNRGGDKFGGGYGGGFGMGSSDGSIVISGGKLYIQASGDGIDANGTLEISGGYTVLCGHTQGDTAVLDYDLSATITGGTFIGTGSSMMAQTFSDATQGVIAVSVGSQSAGANIILKDSSDNVIFEYSPELSYQILIISMPEIVSGELYKLYVGSLSGEIEAQ